MKLFFVLNARMPTKKAYGIHVAKMSEAFLESGVELIVVIPNTRVSTVPFREFYGLTKDVSVVTLPALDWYDRGSAGFILSTLTFSFSTLFYFWKMKRSEREVVIYTADMDRFSFAFLPLTCIPVFSEVHDWRGDTIFTRYFFKHTKGIIATNKETAFRLKGAFKFSNEKVLIEANGADLALIKSAPTQSVARERLAISPHAKIALYVGRFYDWKGLDVLIPAALNAPEISWYVVGGTKEEFLAAIASKVSIATVPENICIPGECSFEDVPVWLAAADVLLIIGTKSNPQSYKHTSPMKVYEYMAANRPIVASATPALTSIIPSNEAFWTQPDDAKNLAETVRKALDSNESKDMLIRASRDAEEHSWKKRAERILLFLENS